MLLSAPANSTPCNFTSTTGASVAGAGGRLKSKPSDSAACFEALPVSSSAGASDAAGAAKGFGANHLLSQ